MEITEERINAAYAVADNNVKKVLDELFGNKQDNRTVIERVKTFDDALKEIGECHPYVKALRTAEETGDENLVQYCRIRIITAALNEGWTPKFTEGENRYYPFLWLYKNEEHAREYALSFDKVKPIPKYIRSVPVLGDGASFGSVCCFACAGYGFGPIGANPGLGSRLCFKTRELALHAAEVFYEEYLKFNLL